MEQATLDAARGPDRVAGPDPPAAADFAQADPCRPAAPVRMTLRIGAPTVRAPSAAGERQRPAGWPRCFAEPAPVPAAGSAWAARARRESDVSPGLRR